MSIFVGYSLGELSSVPAEDHRYGEHKRLSLQMERSVLRRFENDFPRLGLLLRRSRKYTGVTGTDDRVRRCETVDQL